MLVHFVILSLTQAPPDRTAPPQIPAAQPPADRRSPPGPIPRERACEVHIGNGVRMCGDEPWLYRVIAITDRP